jgi:hypothetical protein
MEKRITNEEERKIGKGMLHKMVQLGAGRHHEQRKELA